MNGIPKLMFTLIELLACRRVRRSCSEDGGVVRRTKRSNNFTLIESRDCGINSRFTLIELLVVIAIISILMTILLPSLNQAKFQARLSLCQSQHKQMYAGTAMYADDNEMQTPKGCPHGGWGFAATYTGYWNCNHPDGSDWMWRPYDRASSGHRYRGLTVLYALNYLKDKHVLVDPDWMNTVESGNISYNGKVDFSKFTKKPNDPLQAGGWLYGTYVFWTYAARSQPIGGDGKGNPRRLDKPVMYGNRIGTTALTMCRSGTIDQKTLGAHKKRRLNCTYSDGHVTTLRDVPQQFENIYKYGGWRNTIGNKSVFMDNPKSTWWAWAYWVDQN